MGHHARDAVVHLARGQTYAYSFDVRPGQNVKWDFTVKKGLLDSFGDSDVTFTAVAFWLADDGEKLDAPDACREIVSRLKRWKLDTLEKPQYVKASQGKVKQNFVASKPGVIWLRWTNDHSMMRGKSIKWSLQVSNSHAAPTSDGATNGHADGPQKSEQGQDKGWNCCGSR